MKNLYNVAGDITEDTPLNSCEFFKEEDVTEDMDKIIRINLPEDVKTKRKNGHFITDNPKMLRDISHDIMFRFNNKWVERNDLKDRLPLYKAQAILVNEEGYHYSSHGFVRTVRQ